MTLALAAAAAILGAILGSFIATVCLRWPRGEQATTGRSKCDSCGRILGPVELVPIVSGLLARGRCPSCKASIEPLHLQVEVAAATIGGLALAISPDGRGAALALFGWLLLAPAALDARHFWLPDRLTALLAAVGLAAGGSLSDATILDRLIGGATGFAMLALLATAYRRTRGREGLGGGDAKLLGAIGLWTGWAALPAILLVASLVGLAGALAQRRGASDKVPLGTLMALGAWIWAVIALQFPQVGLAG